MNPRLVEHKIMNTPFSAWFAGPSGENSSQFSRILNHVYEDYVYWRRNFFPEDGVVIGSEERRAHEPFMDEFEDRLMELLGKLKADFPFQSPRYAAHMISEQTLPSIAGMFAGLLYNPNNVSSEAAPVTVKMELEVSMMLAEMLGYSEDAWAHLCSGGTIANIEALWIARSVKFLPFVIKDVAEELSLDVPERKMSREELLSLSPTQALQSMRDCFLLARKHGSETGFGRALSAFHASPHNVTEVGLAAVCNRLSLNPVLIVPETSHYCLPKALDLLGIGRKQLRRVPVDQTFRIRAEALEDCLDEAHQAGETVIGVVAVVGTTEEGAVDPVDEVLDLREKREQEGKPSFWVHLDAAYGGYLRTMVVPNKLGLGEKRATVKLDGKEQEIELQFPTLDICDALGRMGEADSIAIDPHKLGFVPYPAGAVCFRSNLVKPIARQDAPYIEDHPGDVEEERRSQAVGVYILEGSKPGSVAAGLWLSHKLIPLNNKGHGRLVQETVRNACEFYTLLDRFADFSRGHQVEAVPLSQPGSNIVCYAFRAKDKKLSIDEINKLNKEIYSRMTIAHEGEHSIHGQEFFVSRTVLSPKSYRVGSVKPFLSKLGIEPQEYESGEVFLLRSVFMNPWYGSAKTKGRFYISELVEALHRAADSSLLQQS